VRKPEISIILPVWNAQSTLEQTLQSILNQTDVSFELIVLDNESTDGSREIIQSFQPQIHHFISGKDRGVYDAMNRGIQQATGKWLYFIGADDYLASDDSLKNVLAYAEEDADLLIGEIEYAGGAASNTRTHYPPRFDKGLVWRNVVHHQACLYRSRCFEEYRYPIRFGILGDYHLNLWLWNTGSKAALAPTLLAVCGADGISKRYTSQLYGQELEIKKELLEGWKLWVQPIWLFSKKWFKKLT
jgi:putative colanic acid biosynthesis glycosyltransferase